MIKVLIVDDEPLLADSLEIILTYQGGMQVVGKAGNGIEALQLLETTHCDVALVDLNMPGMGGIPLIPRLKALDPKMRILVLTTFYDEKYIAQAIAAHADGYLLKDTGKESIFAAIQNLVSGQSVIDSKVMAKLSGMMQAETEKPVAVPTQAFQEPLSQREQEILTQLCNGLTNRQIAQTLYISEGTVKNYISSIYEKTGIHDRAKLIVFMQDYDRSHADS